MTRRVFVPLLLVILALAGCAHQAAEQPAPATLPAKFSQSGEAPLPSFFWQAFADPQLDSLVQQAFTHNYSLAAQQAVLNQADVLLQQQRAGWWPTLNATLGGARSDGDGVERSRTFSGGFAASYEVDLWGRIGNAVDAAALQRDASVEDLKAARITLASDVTLVWYQLVAQRQLQALQQQQLDTNDKVLQLVTARFRQGQADAADVLRQQVLLEQNRAALATTASDIQVLDHALSILIGQAPGATLPVSNTLPALPPLPATGLTADWLQQRPDLRSAYLGVAAADAEVAAAIAERYPRLDLTANVSSSASRSSDLFDDWLENLAANLLLPIVDGGARRAEVARREAVVAERFARYQQTLLTAVAEVEDALSREYFQHQRLQHLRNKMTLDDQVVQRLNLRYRAGNVDYLDVLQALTDQQQTQQDVITAQQQLLEYRIALARALATGWTAESPESPTQVTQHESASGH